MKGYINEERTIGSTTKLKQIKGWSEHENALPDVVFEGKIAKVKLSTLYLKKIFSSINTKENPDVVLYVHFDNDTFPLTLEFGEEKVILAPKVWK